MSIIFYQPISTSCNFKFLQNEKSENTFFHRKTKQDNESAFYEEKKETYVLKIPFTENEQSSIYAKRMTKKANDKRNNNSRMSGSVR